MKGNKILLVVLLILLVVLLIAQWLLSYRPVHYTCYFDEDYNFDYFGKRIDYFGVQTWADYLSDSYTFNTFYIKTSYKENWSHAEGFTSATLQDGCTKW